uniref:Phospholipid scramblase n=1 Tax=Nannospalax galili TaxID=1026970 RepID=A0A8C6QCB3_NANGA
MEKHNMPAGYGPLYPPAAFQGPPEHTGYPGPQAGYQGPQGAYPGPQPGYPVPPGGYAGAGPGGFPVQSQPVYSQSVGPAGAPWMPAPPPPLNCPPGLEYLILVHQQIELLEVLTGFETNNKYEIKKSFGQRVFYFAVEDDCCIRNCFMALERPLRCSSCCFPCFQAPPGVPVGYVTQTWHPCLPKFTLQNEKKEDILRVVGPCVVCSCCSDIDFEIKSLDEESLVGKISKQWSDFVREAFADADNFGIQFPLDLDVKMKAVMLRACSLIDFISGMW